MVAKLTHYSSFYLRAYDAGLELWKVGIKVTCSGCGHEVTRVGLEFELRVSVWVSWQGVGVSGLGLKL